MLVDWYEGNQQSVRNALENVRLTNYRISSNNDLYFLQLHLQKQDVERGLRADEELAKWEQLHLKSKSIKISFGELRLDYDLYLNEDMGWNRNRKLRNRMYSDCVD